VENNAKYYLVRTPDELIKKSLIGVGWSDYNFSAMSNAEEAIRAINTDFGVGRRGNQIRRFFNINDNDIVVVPLPYSIAIGRAKGGLMYDKSSYGIDRANQRKVEFSFDSNGRVRTVPRGDLSGALQRRLRVMGMTVNDLSEFSDEISKALESLDKGVDYSWKLVLDEKAAQQKERFKLTLLRNIQTGKTNLQEGGIGLESLVKELLEAEGYTARVMAKRAMPQGVDADIQASREDPCAQIKILVQVKHHQGNTNINGVEQLLGIKELDTSKYDDYQLVFLTTASVPHDVREKAENNSITVVDGEGFVEWIANRIDSLSNNIKTSLRIADIPQLIE